MKKILSFILFALLLLPLEGQGILRANPFYLPHERTYATVLNDGSTWAYFIAASEYITLDEADSVVTWANSLGDCPDLGSGTTSTRKPIFAGDSVTFNGSTNLLFTSVVNKAQPLTIYIVLNQVSWTDEDRIYGATSAYLKQDYSSPDIRLYAGASSSLTDGPTLGTRSIIRAVLNGANSSLQVAEDTAWEGNAGANAFDRFILGNNQINDYATCGNISVYAIIIRDVADSAADQQLIYDYIESTYL